ncbi:MAG: polymer-forming cytoskeletal protein [Lachnospiraceae bacterium]|nr:polymer-forming cytoskeletal protein [Lachnospiraceae bacterium]
MGFFSDLKDDLSQAVNELMPEEELEAALAAQGQTKEQTPAEAETMETPAADMSLDSLDLSDMLDKIEGMEPELGAVSEIEEAAEEASPVEQAPEPMADEPVVQEALAEEITTEEPEIPEEEIIIEEPAIPEIAEAVVEEEAEPVMAEEVLTEMEAPEKEVEKAQNSGGKGKTMEAQANRVAVDETAVVTEGMTITGDIVSEGSLELIGTVNGNLDILGKLNVTGTIQGNSKAAEIYAEGSKITGEVNSLGSVKIGQNSVVIGNITATSAVVAGAVKGDIDVQGPVILDTTAIVMGNIKSKSVQINNGAVIEGMCSQCYADVNPTSFFEEFKKKK